jgi:hypothetical protein
MVRASGDDVSNFVGRRHEGERERSAGVALSEDATDATALLIQSFAGDDRGEHSSWKVCGVRGWRKAECDR